MPRSDKAAAVAELTEAFTGATAAVLTEYRGLTVSQLTELRRALGADTRYAVVKNTLTKIAAQQAGLAELESLLEGPTAIAFVDGDPVVAAKGVRDFARTHPLLLIKGGVLDGRPVTADEIRRLADLESREVLLAKLAGAMQGSLSQAVSLFAAPLSQAVRLAEALRQQRAEQADSEPAAELTTEPGPKTAAPATELPAEPGPYLSAAPAEPGTDLSAALAELASQPATEPPAEPATETATPADGTPA